MTLNFLKSTAATLAVATLIAAPVSAAELTTYAQLNDTRPGNITVTPDKRVIVTQQPLDGPALRVVEVLPDGSLQPFPTQDWADGPETGEVGLSATIGIDSDANGVVWVLDMGSDSSSAQIVGWDTREDKLHRVIKIPADVITPISFLQDFAIDEKRGLIYIADMTFTAPASEMRPAFIVIDIKTGNARRVLEADTALMPINRDVSIDGRLMGFKDNEGNSTPWHLALNAISIDPNFEEVYFGTINGSEVFRIDASKLADATLDDAALSEAIEVYGKKSPNDGFIVDGEGRVFSGDIESHAVTMTTGDKFEVVAQDDERLRWPDGFAFGPDGGLYIVANQLNTHPALNLGEDASDRRYYILKLER